MIFVGSGIVFIAFSRKHEKFNGHGVHFLEYLFTSQKSN